MPPTRWGLVSAGRICHDFTIAVQLLPPEEHQVVAVAARKISDAKAFAEKFNIPRYYGGYSDLAADPDIDIIYNGTVTTLHADVSKLMMNANKPVLCEKPVTVNSRELREVVQLAKEKQVFFMEGCWSRCFPVYTRLREAIDAGDIGDPVVINIQIGFPRPPTKLRNDLAYGSLMAHGCYNIQLANFIFKDKPEEIKACGQVTESGCDVSTCIILKYPGGKMASLTSTLVAYLSNTAIIQGTKGIIQIPTHWAPVKMTINDEEFEAPMPKCERTLHLPDSVGFLYEAQHVRDCLCNGKLESEVIPHADSLTVMEIMDEVRRQIGVQYPADDIQ